MVDMLRISKLTTENMEGNCITDNPHPVFAFAVKSDNTEVLLRCAVLSVNGWTIETTQQTGIVYGGEPLQPETEYEVHLSVEDNYGEKAQAAMMFSTAKMGCTWSGEWITDPQFHFTEKHISPVPMMFRKKFPVSGNVVSAKVYASAVGIYELTVNGRKAGEDYFAPGFTSYSHQLQYQCYDITEMLRKENTLTAVAAGGWAVGSYTYRRMNRLYGDRQAFLCEIVLKYENGMIERIGTGPDWQVTEEGSYRAAEFYDGEVYDATIETESIPWRPAGIEQLRIHPQLTVQYGTPVRAHEEMIPVSVHKAGSGVLIYDFGQNFAGVICARIRGKKGQKIIFRHAEILMDGELFTEPLRSAKQQAVYICCDGEQEYQPRLTYMGFRYVGVEGIEKKDLELKAYALYSDVPAAGGFSCSDERLNKLQQCITWGAKSNFVDIPTDCPQRDERLGWTGDIALFAPTAAFNFNMSRFFEKWLRDLKSEQGKGGGIPMIVPHVKIKGQFEMLVTMAVDHWGDACILVPWAEYRARGDISLLAKMYPVMKRYIKACLFWTKLSSPGRKHKIWKLLFHYGDWCAPDTGYRGWKKRGKWTATACLAHSLAIVSQTAQILGESGDARYYRKLSREISESYRKALMQPDGTLKKEFQTGYVLPLYYGLLEGDIRKKAAANLARMVREGGYHIRTGFPGTPYILFALADNGYVEDAYRMLMQDTCPSWLYEVKAGGTTFWERWDALREDGTCNQGEKNGDGGMVSFNHYAAGAVGDFLYRRIAGIEPIEGGYRTFRVAPKVGGNLKSARGYVETPYGYAASEWKIENRKFALTVAVPEGTRCEIVLPGGTVYAKGSGIWSFMEEMK